jgi:MSHA pilin protein MshA
MLKSKRSCERGFTLVELIIIMVILSILSAFLVPRFATFDRSARIASISALSGTLLSAMTMVHNQSVTEGTASLATSTTTLEGQTVNLVYGYPSDSGASPGILSSIGHMQGYTVGATTPPVVFSIQTNCSVTYTAATSATAPASVTTNTSGC